tara:strand:- start:6203 stop:6844 length:642 start_codon:yes stop_codon:yes gene_type:complete
MIIDFYEIIKKEKIEPKGVIHIGAHIGQELVTYEKCGFKDVLMIEANPTIFDSLVTIKSDICDLIFLNVAVSDQKGVFDFNITSNGRGGGEMSSSLLKLKRHKQLYPNIRQVKTISVNTDLIDNILRSSNLSNKNYNMMNLDIQGAELMALKGSIKTLKNIDIINTEINKTELYEDCVLLDELEKFLFDQGFYKHSENYKYSPEWGDAIFLKK